MDKKRRIEALVVVEGKSDTQRLQQFFDVETFETSGMGLTDEMLQQLQKIAHTRSIIIFTDPDLPGETIRRKVSACIPHVQHAILTQAEARSTNGKKLGVEHASKQSIEHALSGMHTTGIPQQSMFTQQDMLSYGFVGQRDSKQRRDYLADILLLGRVNAKQFLRRLNLFGITHEAVTDHMEVYGGKNGINSKLS